MAVPPSDFIRSIERSSSRSKSRLVLALDLGFRERETESLLSEAIRIVEETKYFLCAVKLNFHLIIPLSRNELGTLNDLIVRKFEMPSIADIKLNDIENTNGVATDYLWSAGFSAVIVNPFTGYEGGLEQTFKKARQLGKGVITLAYMSHKGADEGYGLLLNDGRSMFDLFLERAKEWCADGILMGSTRPEKIAIARKRVGPNIKIFCPGSGAQGGDSLKSLEAGSDYLIYGRSIIESKDPQTSARQIYSEMIAWKESHQRL